MIRSIWMFWETTALQIIVKRMLIHRGGYQCQQTGKLHLGDMVFSLDKRKFVYGLQYTTSRGLGRISSPTLAGLVQILREKLKEWKIKKKWDLS